MRGGITSMMRHVNGASTHGERGRDKVRANIEKEKSMKREKKAMQHFIIDANFLQLLLDWVSYFSGKVSSTKRGIFEARSHLSRNQIQEMELKGFQN